MKVLFQNCLLWLFGWVPPVKTKLLSMGTALHLLNILLNSKRQSSTFQMDASFQESLLCTFCEPLFLSQENTRNWVFRLPLHWLLSCTYFHDPVGVSVCVWSANLCESCLGIYLTFMNSTNQANVYFSSDLGWNSQVVLPRTFPNKTLYGLLWSNAETNSLKHRLWTFPDLYKDITAKLLYTFSLWLLPSLFFLRSPQIRDRDPIIKLSWQSIVGSCSAQHSTGVR